ncbi:MAG: DUF4914 family protein [Clostridiales bacterium]|jgi:hypothetical protein|nr:DUF4914 family protein [Clostridiales bacterium]
MHNILDKVVLPSELKSIVCAEGMEIIVPDSREELMTLALGGPDNTTFDVCFDVKDKGQTREASVSKCKNGIVINFDDNYMRRRDPDSMVIADNLPTDKATHEARFKTQFDDIRQETFEWLKDQKSLICMPFLAGNDSMGIGYASMLVVPVKAAFFALMLADMQGFIPVSRIPNFFRPRAVVYVAPPFRHLYYDGLQVVIHNRLFEMHEVFSYNLYPGPSAKKGIYSVLLNLGEQERWITLHAATVKIITPYELTVTIMHEGASGGGKSEMNEQFHREPDGRLLLGVNTVSGEEFLLTLMDACELHPVTDDMALCHPFLQQSGTKLTVADAEDGWFLRVNHITQYGTAPQLEKNTIHPQQPLVFLNLQGAPGSTCLIWEPVLDGPGKPCPNPRVIIPRQFFEGHVDGAVEVDVRSFGIRTPPCTKENPTYGIIGMFHVLPPALAWLWRLVSPRGHANPSIMDSDGMQSEGVGSYWPFATGKMVDQANLLLEQIMRTLSTRYILIANQYIGAYHVGFAGQWVTREFISRRGGAKFQPEATTPSRCPLLGYSPKSMRIDGTQIPKAFLQVDQQPEVGVEGYDAGAALLNDFFKREAQKYLTPDLLNLGRKIIAVCLNDGGLQDYYDLIPKL